MKIYILYLGYDFNGGIDYQALFHTYKYSGFQATNFGLAVDEIKRMLHIRSIPLNENQIDNFEEDEYIKRKYSCTIFLGYTSNMVSCGIRDTIRFLVQHKMVGLKTYTQQHVSHTSVIQNKIFVGRLYCYYSRWSRGGFNKVFSTYIYWKI